MLRYTHTQSVAATTWTVDHNLGGKPIVEVTVDIGNGERSKIYPKKILHASDDHMLIEFTTPRSGVAQLIY